MYKFEFILWLNFYDPVILGRKKNCRLKEGKRTSFLLRYSRILYGVYISSSSFTYTRRLSHIFLMFHISSHTHTHKWAIHKLHAEIWIILITQRIETNIKDFFFLLWGSWRFYKWKMCRAELRIFCKSIDEFIILSLRFASRNN